MDALIYTALYYIAGLSTGLLISLWVVYRTVSREQRLTAQVNHFRNEMYKAEWELANMHQYGDDTGF